MLSAFISYQLMKENEVETTMRGSKFIDLSRYVFWWTATLGSIICSLREHFLRLFCWNEDFSKFRNKSSVPGFATLDLINLTLEMHRYSQWRGACTGLQWKRDSESELGERPNLVSMQIRINLENFDLVDTLELLKRSFADLILLTTSNLERKVFLKPCPSPPFLILFSPYSFTFS